MLGHNAIKSTPDNYLQARIKKSTKPTAMETGPLSFLKMTSGKAAGVNEKTAVLQKFALRGALAYVKANPKCGIDSQQAAEIFEGVLMTGIKEMENEPIVYNSHEWRLFKRLSGKIDSDSNSESTSKAKAKEPEVSTVAKPASKPKKAQPQQSTTSTDSGKTSLSKAKKEDLLKMCEERGIAVSDIKVVHGKQSKPVNADLIAAIKACDIE